MNKIFWCISLIFLMQSAGAQQISDAIRYSYLNPSGTARFMGSGGAFTASGADFAGLSQNPAGLAMFRTNEFSLSPGLRFANATTRIGGQANATEEDKSNFNFGNIGLVFATQPQSTYWKSFNFGIGMNKLANFNQAIYYEGAHPGTIINSYFPEIQQLVNSGGDTKNLDPFGAKLAWDAGAVYFQDDNLTNDFEGVENAPIQHSQALITSGHVNEMVFSFAGNYDEKLMVGATIGVPFVNYQLETTYEESDPNDLVPFFDKLTRTEFLRTNGLGVNLKMGVIYRINPAFRIGAAFHTPTFLSLTDNFENTFRYAYTDGSGANDSGDQYSPNGTFDYKLRTPFRASVGGSFVFLKYSYIGADIEFVDYAANKFNLTSNNSSTENQSFERTLNNDIRKTYGRATNIRIGGQLRKDMFLVRGGLSFLGDYVEGNSGFNMAYTAGAGVRAERFYVELGYRNTKGNPTVSPYFDPQLPQNQQLTAQSKAIANDFILTLGFKF